MKTGAAWRWMPNDLPPWAAVYRQTERWLAAGCFEALVDDLWVVLCLAAGLHVVAFACLMMKQAVTLAADS